MSSMITDPVQLSDTPYRTSSFKDEPPTIWYPDVGHSQQHERGTYLHVERSRTTRPIRPPAAVSFRNLMEVYPSQRLLWATKAGDWEEEQRLVRETIEEHQKHDAEGVFSRAQAYRWRPSKAEDYRVSVQGIFDPVPVIPVFCYRPWSPDGSRFGEIDHLHPTRVTPAVISATEGLAMLAAHHGSHPYLVQATAIGVKAIAIHGHVIEIAQPRIRMLDRIMGTPRHFVRRPVPVIVDGKAMMAAVYLAAYQYRRDLFADQITDGIGR